MRHSIPIPLFMIFAGTFLFSCAEQPVKVNQQPQIISVPFPNTEIPGFELPTDSTVINQWLDEQNNEEIHKHGWGIWTGLLTMRFPHYRCPDTKLIRGGRISCMVLRIM